MKIDLKRQDRQLKVLERWRTAFGNGILEAVTGFGKTYVAVLLIKSMNEKFPERKTNVVVPTRKLRDDWTREEMDKDGRFGHLKEHNLTNVHIYVVNTYIKYKHDCELLICDEIHHYANEKSATFSMVLSLTNYNYVLGLTATLNNKERDFLSDHGVPIIDTISPYEAEKNQWIAKSIIYNLGLELPEEDKEYYEELHKKFNSAFALFEHNFELAMACRVGKNTTVRVDGIIKTGKEWREWYAFKKGWDGTKEHKFSEQNIGKYARWFGTAMTERMNFLHNHPAKIVATKKIIEKFPLQTMVFSQTKDFAEKITKAVGTDIASTYHSSLPTEIRGRNGDTIAIARKTVDGTRYFDLNYKKLRTYLELKEIYGKIAKVGKDKLRQEAIDNFQDKENSIRVLSTVKALDEGFDIQSIQVAIMAAYYSVPRQDIQRRGRSGRYEKDKIALIVNLYMKDTQEERGWLKHKQKGIKFIHWITSPEELILQETLHYGNISLI